MAISIFSKNHESLIKVITASVDNFERKKLHRHELWILTCYINIGLIEELANVIKNSVKLTNIYVVFDISEAHKNGIENVLAQFNTLKSNLFESKISLEYMALDTSGLSHCKGYALYQRVNDKIEDGIVVITSANFTKSGFWGNKNIEIGYVTNKKADLQKFEFLYNSIWTDYGVANLDSELIIEDENSLQFALLQGGIFLHKWEGSISQQIGLRYYLTDKAKTQRSIIEGIEGLDIEAEDTITHQILNLSNLPKKALPKNFTRMFTIDTNWGRWCPSTFWDNIVPLMGDFSDFQDSFKENTTEDELDKALARVLSTQLRLMNDGIIKSIQPDTLTQWKRKILNLRESKSKLERIFTGYSPSQMPFDISNTKEIGALFNSLMESINLSTNRNVTMKKFLIAYENRQISYLIADSDDINKINNSK